LFIGVLLELSVLEPLGISAWGAGPGMVGGVLEWSKHHPKTQVTCAKVFVLL